MNYKTLCALLAVAAVVPPCSAGREPEPWDTLPSFNLISFSSSAVGFAAKGGVCFTLDRADRQLSKITAAQFAAQFTTPTPQNSLETSDGAKFTVRDANCSAEGDNSPHALSLDGAVIKDSCKPCSSISAVETAYGLLWLGTRFDGEYGEYPAEGIVVDEFKTGALKARISEKSGLAGDLVRVIRRDPFTGNVWAATNYGINEITPELKVVFAKYMYEDFDPADGAAAIFLSSALLSSNPLAVVGRRLGVSPPEKYYAAALTIPRENWQCFNLEPGFPTEPCKAGYESESGKNFLPKAFNALVPFFLEAASSTDEERRSTAVWLLCQFNDMRVYDFFSRAERNPHSSSYSDSTVKECLGKYESSGLAPSAEQKRRAALLLKQIANALVQIKESGVSDEAYYAYHGKAEADASLSPASVVDNARALLDSGDARGVEVIVKYFRYLATGNNADGELFERLGQELHYRDEIAPAMQYGLGKIIGANAARGCDYFDVTYRSDSEASRYGARYLPALLAALENAVPEKVPHQPSQAESVQAACRKAFLSQIKNPSVKDSFLKEYYPALTPARRKIADSIMR
ncbi:MAG: hypothetical protein WCS77_07910 [Elusimicrobiaceae bacterium]